ncbi:MAG: hypothetical protein LBS67_04715 [Clostridiales Family XIII bacterium]|nr:hypothetical protein [Clostridiales Family XIII bacterium]
MKNLMIKKRVGVRALPITLAVILALVLSLGSLTAVFADDPEVDATAALTKVFEMAEGTTTPEAEFTFDITTASENVPTDIPSVNDVVVEYDSAVLGTTHQGLKTVPLQSGNIFAGVNFPHAGIYIYDIAEEESGYTIDQDTETLTYSDASYKVKVYVEQKQSGTGTYIKAIESFKTTDDAGTSTDPQDPTGGKVDPTPGTPDPEPEDPLNGLSSMTFTNVYVKNTGGGGPPSGSNTVLSASKTVIDGGDEAKYFPFTVKVTKPATIDDTPTYKGYVMEGGSVVTSASNGAIVLAAGQPNNYINFVSGTDTTVKLKHGQSLVFTEIEVGATYVATESAQLNYNTSIELTADDVVSNLGEVLTTGAARGVTEGTDLAAFTNAYDEVTPTGVVIDNLPYLGLIALAIAALAVYLAAKRRRRIREAMATERS